MGCRDLWDLLLPIPGFPFVPRACFLGVYTGAKGCLEILSFVFNSSSVVSAQDGSVKQAYENKSKVVMLFAAIVNPVPHHFLGDFKCFV